MLALFAVMVLISKSSFSQPYCFTLSGAIREKLHSNQTYLTRGLDFCVVKCCTDGTSNLCSPQELKPNRYKKGWGLLTQLDNLPSHYTPEPLSMIQSFRYSSDIYAHVFSNTCTRYSGIPDSFLYSKAMSKLN